MTGESTPVEKDADTILPNESTIGERANMVFMGTNIVAGKARGVVAATGMESELGRIAGFLQTEEREPTPLQKRLEELGRVLIVACLALVAIIFVLQLFRGESSRAHVSHGREPGGGGGARGLAGGGDDCARAWFAAHGEAQRPHSSTGQCGNARFGDGNLFGQNGNADAQ